MRRLALIPLLVLLVFVLVVLGLAGWSVHTATRDAGRLQVLNSEVSSLQDVTTAMASYEVQVAQYLVNGRIEQDDLHASRLAAERSFLRLGRALRDRVVLETSEGRQDGALTDFENARRMLELYHAIDRAAARAMVLEREQQSTQAAEIYARDVDFRLSNEFPALLDDARRGAQARVASAEALGADNRQAMIWGWSAVALIGLVLLVALAWQSWRRPPTLPNTLTRDYEARVEDLRISNKRLRELDTRRSQFLADVSHELRTPLTILRGEADVALLPGSNVDDQRSALERIRDQAAELGQLLDDLLAFARSEGDGQSHAPTPVLLNELVATAVDDGEMLAEPREVQLQTHLPDKGVWILSDARRLKQALIIGLDNAVNHAPPGTGIAVALTVEARMARITIADEGAGLAPKDQAHVFDRFYRGSGHAPESGLGIGLAIARTIVDQHHGTITLDNRPEGGAVLTIRLPLHERTH